MKIKIFPSKEKLNKSCLEFFLAFVSANKKINAALPTGKTPIGFYQLLIKQKGIIWQKINIFMLDVLYPQKKTDTLSYETFIKEMLLTQISLPPDNFHILDSEATNPFLECQNYEKKILDLNGIDLAILGIGQNGHIAFNEPGSSFDSRTRLVNLTSQTIDDNRNTASGSFPHQGLTMGIKTIMAAKKIVLIASGENKKEAVLNAVKGEVSSACPASVLQNHPDCTFLLDEKSASLL